MKRIERARNVVRRGGGRENEERDVCAPVSWSVRDSGQGLEEERRENAERDVSPLVCSLLWVLEIRFKKK